MVHTGGNVAPGYEGVRDAFVDNFLVSHDVGASVAAWAHGRPVVSLWGGTADQLDARPWTADTIVTVFSMTKALTTTALLHLSERGGIELDAPVARWWPEFEANGKGAITVRMLLSHRAGLPAVEGTFTLDEALSWDPIVTALAAQAPRWKPDTSFGYHLRTFGWLVGEVFRRAAGCTVGQYARAHIAGPLGLDWHLPLPEEHEPRVARLVMPPAAYFDFMASLPADLLLVEAGGTPSGLFRYDDMWNTRALRAVELPSSNSVTNAAAVAKFYAALLQPIDGVRLLQDETVADATIVRSSGADQVLMSEMVYGTGYTLAPSLPAAVGAEAFGHGGAGGSIGFADPSAGLAFAYTQNKLVFALTADQRRERLVDALYESHRAAG